MIAIVDYGMGNCGSIRNMFRYLGAESIVVDTPDQLDHASAIILPGVGSFDHGVSKLNPFRSALNKRVLRDKIPFMGICLGMQLLFESSEEGGIKGLGWIRGRVKRFDFRDVSLDRKLVVPHMGWNEAYVIKKNPLFVNDDTISRFYFVHSFHAEDVPTENIISSCHYGYDFTCAVQRENIFGVQFHPEKSHRFGKQIFRNFLELI